MMLKQQLARLSKGALIYGVGGLINNFIGLLLLPLFTAYLTPVDYGISSILNWLTFLVMPVFSLGLGAAIAPCYFESNNRERKGKAIWTTFTLLAASVSLLAILGMIFAGPISQLAFQTPRYGYLVTISLLGTCLSILTTPFMVYLQFEERAKLFVMLSVVTTLASIGLSLLMVVMWHRGIQGMIESGLIARGITLGLFLLPAILEIKFRFSPAIGRELLRLGVPLIPSFIFLFMLQQGNRYVLQWFHGLEAVGIYTIGYSFGMVMNLLVSSFTSAWVPFFMSFMDRREEARALFSRILTYYVFGFGALSLLFFIVAKPAVMLMTQPTFHEAYKVVGLSASAQFLIGVFSILTPAVYFSKEVEYVSLVQACAAVVAIGANLLLISIFGLVGAALSLMLGFLSMAVFMHVWNWRRRHDYFYVRYEWHRILVFVPVYAIYMVLMLWERNFSLSSEIAISAVAAALLLPVLYLLLNGAEHQMVWDSLRQLRTAWMHQLSAKA